MAECRLYKPVLLAFMRYRDSVDYPKDAEFTQEQLAAITADDVVSHFNFSACGCADPAPEDRPKNCQSNALHHWKKALSAFMPNRNHQWNEMTSVGNPTKSQSVNDMINKVKKFEARKQGALLKARRPMKEPEFRAIVSELRGTDDESEVVSKCGIPAVMIFQFHLIGRLDDCCEWLRMNLKPHDTYPKMALKAKLCWGKNAHEEWDAPWQHVFGCVDWTHCCLLNVGMWLEVFHSSVHGSRERPFVVAFSDEIQDDEKAAKRCKNAVCGTLWKLLKDFNADVVNDDADDNDKKVGMHSIQKFASTWTCRNGISCNDKDHRGRWKQKQVSDTSDDVELDYIDAKVAAFLCPTGVCNYVVNDPACTQQWICTNATQAINEMFGDKLLL